MEAKGRIVVLMSCALLLQNGISAFNFPTDNGAPPPPQQAPPAAAADASFPMLSERQVITPAIVTPTNSCICVPTGSCNFGTVVGNTDGSGLIDIRIVNSVSFSFILSFCLYTFLLYLYFCIKYRYLYNIYVVYLINTSPF